MDELKDLLVLDVGPNLPQPPTVGLTANDSNRAGQSQLKVKSQNQLGQGHQASLYLAVPMVGILPAPSLGS